jgi:hypothetical protein
LKNKELEFGMLDGDTINRTINNHNFEFVLNADTLSFTHDFDKKNLKINGQFLIPSVEGVTYLV